MTDNNTFSRAEVVKAVKDWNFAISIFLLFITVLLQWGYPSRCKPLWVVKMCILWLLWPLSIAAAVFAAVYPINTVAFGFAIAFACISGLMWLSYFISSFRLLCRTGSAWSFMPETNMLLNVPLSGRTVTRPILTDSPAIQFLLLRGVIQFDGFNLGRCDPAEMPDIVTVAKPSSLHWYKKALTRNIGAKSAIFVYIKYKVGNHRVQNNNEDGERLAMFVA
ncbi:membrane glycoprotein [Bat coronavirus HKU9-10-2]|uniref:Membrane protein n=1 Tax=Bat coronavirus HKU9-10-2 TaxID=875613 RepID=E0ZN63_BCHK9|nr:membrane glycoprotein [Bat coronavirus HKU9-10-2]URD31360.1 matrix protein [Rousettus bat coronavirus]WBV74430.1 membrane glycoprotein [Rousettus bat coronavirus HKU9]